MTRSNWIDVPENKKYHCADCGWLNPTKEDVKLGAKINGNWYCSECLHFRAKEYNTMLEFSDMSFEEMTQLILKQRNLILTLLLCSKKLT